MGKLRVSGIKHSEKCVSQILGCMLKAPPGNPRVYIYRYYNIDPKEGF